MQVPVTTPLEPVHNVPRQAVLAAAYSSHMIHRVIYVFLGSGLGGVARYLLGGWIQNALGAQFPYGTITINTTGSFLIALIMTLSLNSDLIGPDLRVALTTGIMGGYTTYSTFNYETISLFQQGSVLVGITNVAVTVVACLIAGGLGVVVARWLLHT